MNNQSRRFSPADTVALVCALAIGVAFFFLPWAEISGEAWTAGRLLAELHPTTSTGISARVWFVLVAAFVGAIFAAWGMFDGTGNHITGGAVVALGVVSLLYFILHLANGDERVSVLGAGFWLALVMSVGLVVQIFMPRIRTKQIDAGKQRRYLNVTLGVVVAGLLVSGYLSYVKLTNTGMLCIEGSVFNCDFVQSSSYSEIAGIPIAILGFVTYIIIGVLLLMSRYVPAMRDYGQLLAFGVALFAWMFSMYLVFVQGEILRAWCQWCLTHELIITIVFVLMIVQLYWTMIYVPDEEEV